MTTARLKGLEQDLGLSGTFIIVIILKPVAYYASVLDIQYDAIVAVLYASYCPAQIPSNMVCIKDCSL